MATESSMPTVDLDQAIDVKERLWKIEKAQREIEGELPIIKYIGDCATPLAIAQCELNIFLHNAREFDLKWIRTVKDEPLHMADMEVCVLIDHDANVRVLAGNTHKFLEAEDFENGLHLSLGDQSNTWNKFRGVGYQNVVTFFREVAGSAFQWANLDEYLSGNKTYEQTLCGYVTRTIHAYLIFLHALLGRVVKVNIIKPSHLTRWNRRKSWELDRKVALIDRVANDLTTKCVITFDSETTVRPVLSEATHCFYLLK